MLRKSVTLLLCIASALARNRTLPDGFLVGAGSAAYQVEGGWDADGKGPSMWDVFLHENNFTNADVAADVYERWEEDIGHITNMGLDFYRFSISWPRILSDGTLNSYNQAGVDFYLNFIKALVENGIEPMVTMYHWDMPEHLSKMGGFLNPQFVDYFEDYARLIFTLFGSYVKYWATFNEPFIICNFGYGGADFAPGLNLTGDGLYQCGYVLLLAHARAYKVYDEEFRSLYNGSIGLVLNSDWRQGRTNSTDDLEAQERAMQYSFGWFANPVYNGNWPQVMIDRIGNRSIEEGLTKSRLPELTDDEIAYIYGTHDHYLAFNTYGTRYVTLHEYDISTPNYLYDLGADTTVRTVDPAGIRRILNWINDRYSPESIIITENGLATTNDTEKQEFLKNYYSNVLDAVEEDGVNVIGYSYWAFLDTYEWIGYYTKKFGLLGIDFDSDNRTRTWRGSAYWYQNLTATRCFEVDD